MFRENRQSDVGSHSAWWDATLRIMGLFAFPLRESWVLWRHRQCKKTVLALAIRNAIASPMPPTVIRVWS